jgi:hypothetical protein
VAEDREPLAAHRRRRERRLGAGRLPDVDDPRTASRRFERGPERLRPEHVDDKRRPVATARFLQPGREVVAVERDDLVGSQVTGALEPLGVAAGRDDALGAEEPGSLDRDRADGARRSQDEDAVVRLYGSPLREREPAGDPSDPAGGGDCRLEPVGHGDGE